MITHQAFASVVASVFRRSQQMKQPFGPHDVHVSYLPLAHSLESGVITVLMSVGAQVAFFQGDIRKIGEDWKALRPTVMAGVPRIFNKTYERIKSKVNAAGGIKKWAFDKAETTGKEKVRDGEYSKWYDDRVWKSVRAELGFDRVRFLASGGAPIPPNILEFVRVLCGPQCVVTQGYGLTESIAVSFLTNFTDFTVGHVGVPIDNLEFRLVSAPECDYYVTDKVGSCVCLEGGEKKILCHELIFKKKKTRYFKSEDATSKAVTSDGWLCTGDIGRINPNGTLSIIDRRKNLFKTCQGGMFHCLYVFRNEKRKYRYYGNGIEYIAAEKVEGAYSVCEAISQIWVYGNSYKSFIVAVVVPNPIWIWRIWQENKEWASETKPGTVEFINAWNEIAETKKDAIKNLVFKEMSTLKLDLEKFEIVKDIMLECHVDEFLQGFSIQNDTLTPSFKLKRPQLFKKFSAFMFLSDLLNNFFRLFVKFERCFGLVDDLRFLVEKKKNLYKCLADPPWDFSHSQYNLIFYHSFQFEIAHKKYIHKFSKKHKKFRLYLKKSIRFLNISKQKILITK
ncbi:hypothetical protein RFI_16820 [Reticulomyxa filosa]|uniref:AMP-dependent synthetase/ligase domain-containing protein n=1 Tax=Reticulomyxa filosa TaxID=46433 RepID=X6N2C4_RETFI|nr:hypothetical protein RFI_16820 [Reticulomyxa filosa]|eukprot:ETO20395.1 hypothetical protein RFI_16820 [Reticulomyxa filosa]